MCIKIKISSYVSSRMEKNFQNSLEFKPERFMVDSDATDTKYFFFKKSFIWEIENYFENKQRMDRFVYYPFGLGPRNCIGQNFAQVKFFKFILKIIIILKLEFVRLNRLCFWLSFCNGLILKFIVQLIRLQCLMFKSASKHNIF